MMDGFGIAAVGIGVIFIWGGAKGYSPLKAAENIVQGKHPTENQAYSNLTNPNSNSNADNFNIAPGPASGAGGTPDQNRALAKLMVSMSHPTWATGQLWTDWDALWTKESGWSQTAENPYSGAYGIPQSLPPTKMPAKAQKPTSDPYSQIAWGIDDIATTYGDPSKAWQHELQYGWY